MEKSLSSKVLRDDCLTFVRPYSLSIVTPETGKVRPCAEITDTIDEGDAERLTELEKLAYSRGFEAGEKAGIEASLERGYREAASFIKTAALLVEELENLRREIMERSEGEMLELSLAVARKVIHSEIAAGRESVVQIIKAAIKKLTIKDSIKIRLNPEDAAYISGKRPELMEILGDVKGMTIEEDPSVSRGGCIVEAGMAEVDARLEQQMEEIISGLMMNRKDEG